jgi:serine/threonine protein phosphatase PrpC
MPIPKYTIAHHLEPSHGGTADRTGIVTAGETIVIVLSDGAGGTSHAALAAQTVIDQAASAASDMPDLDDDLAWCRLLGQIDAFLADNAEGGQATAVVAAISADGIVGASAGDSGAWLILSDIMYDLTGQQNVKPLLGTGGAVSTPFAAAIEPSTLLIASDGLLKYVNPERICGIVNAYHPDEAVKHLADAARLPTGEMWDDVAIVLCRIEV